MRDAATFEARLAAAYERYVADAPIRVDAAAMTRLVASGATAQPRPWGQSRLLDRRAVAIATLALVAVAVAATLLLIAGQRVHPSPKVLGSFKATGDWAPAPSGPVVDLTATLRDGRVLLVGTASSESTAPAAWLYDPATERFTRTGAPPERRQSATLTTLRDGRVLLAGGWTEVVFGATSYERWPSELEIYDPAAGLFRVVGTLVHPRAGHSATLLEDGRVLIAGGGGAPNATPPDQAQGIAELFDPATGGSSESGQLRVPRAGHVAVRLSDGRVLITGGFSDHSGSDTTAAEIFDPVTDTFAATGSMLKARSGNTASLLADGRVLVVGGAVDGASTATAELFDPVTGSFSATGALQTDRTDLASVGLPDGRVLVVGGSNAQGAPRTAELFDPLAGRFELAGTAAWPHDPAFAVGLPDGRVLVGGLSAPETWSPADAAVAPDSTPRPITIRVAPAAGLTWGQDGQSATMLADGRVLLAGGRQVPSDPSAPATILRSAVLFDPATAGSSRVGDMTTPRWGQTAVLLPDRRILLIGGVDASSPSTATAETFDPSTGAFTAVPAIPSAISAPDFKAADRAVVLADGRVLLAGSAPASPGQAPVLALDPESWHTAATLPFNCVRGSIGSLARLADGRVLVLCPDRGPVHGFVLDPSSPSGSPIEVSGPVLGDQGELQAVRLRDGRVLVISDSGPTALFDPATYVFTLSGAMSGPRIHGRAALLADGRVIVVGGSRSNSEDSQASADVYDPATGAFHVIGPVAARDGPTVTVLADGRVLIVGGAVPSADRGDAAPAGAELLDPSAIP